MEGLKETAMAVCTVSAAIALTEGLTGSGRLKGQVRMMLTLILLLVISAPLVQSAGELELPELKHFEYKDETTYPELYTDALIRETSDSIAGVLSQELEKAGIFCSNIVPEINISEDGCIIINSVRIRSDSPEAAGEVIRSVLGEDTEVTDEAE
ncbi:MAG TPA: hypothetical protein DCZ71_00410 [Ruminococcus sp.]|nr:hypothetical protein [Ruminococcus sp.]